MVSRTMRAKRSLSQTAQGNNLIEKFYLKYKMPLFFGKGGNTRIEITQLLQNFPCNAHQISQMLKKSYRTIRYHLNILQDNDILEVDKTGGNYGAKYFVSPKFNIEIFEKLLSTNR